MSITAYTTHGNLECSACLRKVPGGTKGFTDGKDFICKACAEEPGTEEPGTEEETEPKPEERENSEVIDFSQAHKEGRLF